MYLDTPYRFLAIKKQQQKCVNFHSLLICRRLYGHSEVLYINHGIYTKSITACGVWINLNTRL